MPVWSVQFYNEASDFQPSRYGVVKADTQGDAFILAKENMRGAERADVIAAVVRDESTIPDGYSDIQSK